MSMGNLPGNLSQAILAGRILVHPVSITRFPLRRPSPGAGLLRNIFVHRYWHKIFQGLGPKRRESSNGDRVYIILCDVTCIVYYNITLCHVMVYGTSLNCITV